MPAPPDTPQQFCLPLGDGPTRVVRILFVEDSETDYELLRLQLRSANFTAQTLRVEDGESMRRALASEKWDLVITDHHLPRFSSREAQQTLKEFDPHIPFLIVSGAIGEDVAVDAMLNGADDYIMKSRPRRLLPAIERALAAAAERRERRTAEAARRESESRLQAITANLPGAVFQMVWQPDSETLHIVHLSSGAAPLFEVHEGTLASHPEAILERFDTQQRMSLIHRMRQASLQWLSDRLDKADKHERNDQKSAVVRWEARFVGASTGTEHWVLFVATPRPRGDGSVQFDGVMIDITPQKQAEAAMHASREELRSLTAHLEQIKERERADIAREIHDDIGGMLTKLKVDLAWLRKTYGHDSQTLDRLSDMDEIVNQSVQVSTRIARSLRPGILDYGLVPALEWQSKDFTKRTAIPVRFTCNEDELSLTPDQSTAIFRVCQETLTNIVKHAGATAIDIELFASSDQVSVEIHDNGKGVTAADLAKKSSFGVRGMIERVRALGGWLEVSGAPGKGTTVMMSMPLNRKGGAAADLANPWVSRVVKSADGDQTNPNAHDLLPGPYAGAMPSTVSSTPSFGEDSVANTLEAEPMPIDPDAELPVVLTPLPAGRTADSSPPTITSRSES